MSKEHQLSHLVKNRWVNLLVIEVTPEVKLLIMVLLEILILRNNWETKFLDLFKKKEVNKSLNFKLNNISIKGLLMKIVWVGWQMIKMVLIGHKLCVKHKLLTLKRVLGIKLKFNFRLKRLDPNLQNHKEPNKDYLIFKIIQNYLLLPQVLPVVVNLI